MFSSGTYQGQLEKLVLERESNVLAIYGDEDEFTSISKYRAWSEKLGRGMTVVEIAGGTHFWHGRAGNEMQQTVIAWLSA